MSYPPNNNNWSGAWGGVNPGVDVNGDYIAGSYIQRKYQGYKTAAKDAGTASTKYTSTAQTLKASKPYLPDQKATRTGGGLYYKQGHQVPEPLAGDAASTAGWYDLQSSIYLTSNH